MGIPGGNGAAAAGWVSVRDPRESAFSIEVPKGWKITGGCYRLGANNPRFLIDMTSPDGCTSLRVGDSAVPAFTVPHMGWGEGMRYSTGTDWSIAARYLPGREFAAKYAQGRFAGLCQEMQVKRLDVLPPVNSPEREVVARTMYGEVVNTTTAGQALLRCVQGGQELAAYVAAETTLTASNFSPIQNWAATALISFLTSRGQAQEALRALLRSARSIKINPDWVRQQAALSQQSTAMILEQGRRAAAAQQELLLQQTAQAQAAQRQRFERLDAQRQRQFNEMDDLINGVQWTTDTVTGQQHEVFAGPNPNYFYNPNAGVVINSTFTPGTQFDWHPLIPTDRP
jgi:hypothetical protein